MAIGHKLVGHGNAYLRRAALVEFEYQGGTACKQPAVGMGVNAGTGAAIKAQLSTGVPR